MAKTYRHSTAGVNVSQWGVVNQFGNFGRSAKVIISIAEPSAVAPDATFYFGDIRRQKTRS
jgi:hypothetical protein